MVDDVFTLVVAVASRVKMLVIFLRLSFLMLCILAVLMPWFDRIPCCCCYWQLR